MTDEQREALLEAINNATEAARDYEESHKDAGDNYGHMPRESWSSSDDRNLIDFMRDHAIEACGLEIDDIAELALDNFTMRAEHVFSGSDGNYFCCGAYPVGEIEAQLDYGALSSACGFTVTADHINALGNEPDAYIGSISDDSCLAYLTSDVVWLADISADALRASILESVA